MIYKLSNIASIERIETFTKLPFKYPYLHKPKRKINGLKEQTVCIINMENPNQIMQAIWWSCRELFSRKRQSRTLLFSGFI
nr:hypothetical protein BACT7_24180 [Tenacibaculum mesophilum]